MGRVSKAGFRHNLNFAQKIRKNSYRFYAVFLKKKLNKKNPEKYMHRFLGSLISNPRSVDLHHIIELLNKPLWI